MANNNEVLPVSEEPAAVPEVDSDPIRTSITIAVTRNGNFIFKKGGTDKNTIDLAGLIELAKIIVDKELYDKLEQSKRGGSPA